MYWKRIIQGIVLFLLYWIILPMILVSIGIVLNSAEFSDPVKIMGKLISAIGFVFGMIAASYMITDGGGGPMFCCPPKKLVKCGPFSICRHPVYLGYILYINGLSLIYGNVYSLFLTLMFSILIILWAIIFEERELIKKFPEYSEYRKTTPAFLPSLPKKSDFCPTIMFNFLFFIGHIISWFTWDIKFEKDCNVPEEGVLIAANHVTYLDFAVIVYSISRFMSFPVSLFHYERHKWLYKNVGCFPIKRHQPDIKAIGKIISTIKKGGRVGIFPEAERSWDGRFLGFKEGFDKLVEKLPKPVIGVRIEKAHLLFPRWGKKFLPGKVYVRIKCFDNAKDLEEFLKVPSVDENDVYPSYKGIENYIYRCPKCGAVASIRSSKNGFKCENCGFSAEKPPVGDLWKMHDHIKESLELPFSDEADLIDPYGRTLKKNVMVTMRNDTVEYDGKIIKKESVRSFITEGRKEIFFFTDEGMIGFRFYKTSALLWNDLYDKFWNQ